MSTTDTTLQRTILKEKFAAHFAADTIDFSSHFTHLEDIYDARAKINQDLLKIDLRKALIACLEERLNAAFNTNNSNWTITPKPNKVTLPTEFTSVTETRDTPPSARVYLTNTAAATIKLTEKPIIQQENSAFTLLGQNTKSEKDLCDPSKTSEILLKHVSSCVKRGLSMLKARPQAMAEHLKSLLKFGSLDILKITLFSREIALIFCADIFKNKSLKGWTKEEINNLADDLAFLSFVIILGTEQEKLNKSSMKLIIIEEIQLSGIIDIHFSVARNPETLSPLPGLVDDSDNCKVKTQLKTKPNKPLVFGFEASLGPASAIASGTVTPSNDKSTVIHSPEISSNTLSHFSQKNIQNNSKASQNTVNPQITTNTNSKNNNKNFKKKGALSCFCFG